MLAVTLDDLRRVSEAYLRTDAASTALNTSPGSAESDPELAARLGLETVRL